MTAGASGAAVGPAPGPGLVQVEALANVLNLVPRRVQQLAKDGVFPKAQRGWYPLVPCIQAYIKYWQDRATTPDRESGSRAALQEAKTRQASAIATRQEIEVQEMLHALMPAATHFHVLGAVLAQIATQLKTAPPRWRPRLEDLSGAALQARIEDLMQEELANLQAAALAMDAYSLDAADGSP